ncbi:MAG: DUF202 domain-containing protein [Bacteroidales bacterium]|nr:DUF202 domain-containing protein [Bacteroidales bacterium]
MENSKLIIRDHLAIDRTKLANVRTILSYSRTVIMLLASGITLIKVFNKDSFVVFLGIILVTIAVVIGIIGLVSYKKVNKKIKSYYSPEEK